MASLPVDVLAGLLVREAAFVNVVRALMVIVLVYHILKLLVLSYYIAAKLQFAPFKAPHCQSSPSHFWTYIQVALRHSESVQMDIDWQAASCHVGSVQAPR